MADQFVAPTTSTVTPCSLHSDPALEKVVFSLSAQQVYEQLCRLKRELTRGGKAYDP